MVENLPETNEPVKKREIVVPGELLSEDPQMLPGRGSIKDGNNIHSIFIGLKDVRGRYVNVVPLRGLYMPEMGDKIIGKVADKSPVRWYVDINSKSEASLSVSDAVERDRSYSRKGGRRSGRGDNDKSMTKYKLGDVIICKVISTDRVSNPVITTLGEGLGKINEGICIQTDVPKIPRIIGKRGSMIKLLKEMTSCRLFVSKNGRIWIKGKSEDHERLAIDVINKIKREAHTSGLTDRIQKYIQLMKQQRGLD